MWTPLSGTFSVCNSCESHGCQMEFFLFSWNCRLGPRLMTKDRRSASPLHTQGPVAAGLTGATSENQRHLTPCLCRELETGGEAPLGEGSALSMARSNVLAPQRLQEGGLPHRRHPHRALLALSARGCLNPEREWDRLFTGCHPNVTCTPPCQSRVGLNP